MTVHLRIELQDTLDNLEFETSDGDTIETQVPEDMPPPIVVQVVEKVTLGRGEDEVLSSPVGDPQSDAEFERQMALLKNQHVDLAMFHAHNRGVSRKHARLTLRNLRLTVADLGSTNGTYVNNERLEPNREYPFKEGDELRLGFLSLKLTVF